MNELKRQGIYLDWGLLTWVFIACTLCVFMGLHPSRQSYGHNDYDDVQKKSSPSNCVAGVERNETLIDNWFFSRILTMVVGLCSPF